ncbi:3-oxoacyl-ACP synthase [Athalassotoga saccharophila]|uniref:3-oxoacyl-ACP synthase n=1 Tax=Athalassotoga saccharophila TaxID=1441386 RepID=UPI0018D8059E|nr:3-oxoacyl-ACP synthase [Athalassotoga saccharophila]BBJ28109.1 3-oxoacyl-[acyl-carrier-protein] synthase 3 [Athalassotoga saccharophila]
MTIGIGGIGVYIPENFWDSQKISELSDLPRWVVEDKLGIKKKVMPGSEDHPALMGIKAAKKAIEMAKCDPSEIDVVIWNGSQHKDYPIWLAGTYVAEKIGAKYAWSFDMEAECGSMMVGMKVAKSLILSDQKINTVLLVSGYRNCDFVNYKNPKTRFMYDLGSGGAAVIVRRNAPNTILETVTITDGSFSEDVVVPMGGTKEPVNCEGIANGHGYLDVINPDSMKEKLDDLSMKNFEKVIRLSVEQSGYTVDDIDYLAILHMKRSAHQEVLKRLNLSEEKTIYLENYGHIGQNDQILSISLALDSGKIKDGDLVVLVGAGIGYIWSATTVLWGR